MHDLSFVQDARIDIVAPTDRQQVRLPVRVDWTARDFDGTFGVLVDREPPRPGKTLASIFNSADICKGVDGAAECAKASFLEERGVFETDDTSIRITRLPEKTDGDRREFHDVTIVLLDANGRRIGESGWTVQFELKDN